MEFWLNCCIVFALSVFLAGILIPQILLVAFRKKLFDIPDERKIHQGIVPRLGGIAFTPVIIFTLSFVLGLNCLAGDSLLLSLMGRHAVPISMGLCALLMLYLVGMADDLIGVRYRAKFVIQLCCALLLVAGGLWVDDFCGFLGLGVVSPWFGVPVTLLCVVFVVNAINLIDGVDGLASGLSMAAFIIYGASFIVLRYYFYALLCFAALGVLLPFFYYNVFGNADKGRKIFMGDTGSLTIGLLLVFTSLKLQQAADIVGSPFPNAMVIALSPLIIPCFDVVRVFVHRLRYHSNPFLPDKSHIHHKLLNLGMSHRLVMVTIVTVSVIFSAGNIYLSHYLNVNLLLFIDIAAWTLLNVLISHLVHRRRIALGLDPR